MRKTHVKPAGPRLKGASWHKMSGKWVSYAGVGGKRLYLGLFDTPEDAHAAYQAARQGAPQRGVGVVLVDFDRTAWVFPSISQAARTLGVAISAVHGALDNPYRVRGFSVYQSSAMGGEAMRPHAKWIWASKG